MNITKDEIIELVSQTFECDISTITEEMGIGHHPAWDSIGQISLIMALEGRYNIIIDETNIEQLLTINNIVRYINGNKR